MKTRTKSWLAILMGIVILPSDIYWTYTSAYDPIWLTLGIIILVADLAWIALDYSLMQK